MKRTPVLFAQNIGRMIKFNWFIKGNRKVINTKSKEILESYGYNVVDLNSVLFPREENKKFDFVGAYKEDPKKDENHPDYKATPCYIYDDSNVLLEGLNQAKVLTNTVEVSSDLPELVTNFENNINLTEEINTEMKKRVMLSCTLDSMQEKLPKRKDPERPAWVFAREYGITDVRKNEMLCRNLVTVCEQLADNPAHKHHVLNAFFCVPLEAHKKKIRLDLTSELAVTTREQLNKIIDPEVTYSIELPKLDPVDCTVSLNPTNFYKNEDFATFYPLQTNSLKNRYIQLAFVHYNPTQVGNIFNEEVTETQFFARSLLKGFAVAAAEARALYGEDVKTLPKPVVVPVVQTDGKKFHFTIYQLNTLEVDKGIELKNIFWNSPLVSLYEKCEYVVGRPVLEGYNPDVLKKVLTFYHLQ